MSQRYYHFFLIILYTQSFFLENKSNLFIIFTSKDFRLITAITPQQGLFQSKLKNISLNRKIILF